MASPRFKVEREQFRDIEISAYFFPEDLHLARTYIERAAKYLDMYEKSLGPYAYRRFAMAENFLPTGLSMPTFTLLGQEVLRLPFIPEISLGHEILHQWFGNLVYIDFDRGNWAEGLTTYLADHFYEEQKGNGWAYRKRALLDYQSYVHGKNEMSLRDFQGRTDPASKAIGYGKALMVFHMLKNWVGDQVFRESLGDFVREMRFRKASWADIQRIFEHRSANWASGACNFLLLDL